MSRILFSLLLVLISSTVLCKEPWQCDSLGKYECTRDQTCCRNKISQTGWACFPSQNAVCCSDGVSCCPFNTICNLKDKRCDPKPRSFLQEIAEPVEPIVKQPQEVLAFLSEISDIQPSDAVSFAKGFNEGFSFFKNLAHQDECNPDDPEVLNDIVSIYDIIKNVTITDVSKIIPEILAKAVDAYTRISNISEGCKLFATEIKRVVDGLTEHVKKSGYYTNLTLHTLSNVGTITEKAKNGINAFRDNNYNQSGVALGDLLRFTLFWNFKQ